MHCDRFLRFKDFPRCQGLRLGRLRSKNAAFCVCVSKPAKVAAQVMLLKTPKNRLKQEYLEIHGQQVALGPLPCARLRSKNSCRAPKPKTPARSFQTIFGSERPVL